MKYQHQKDLNGCGIATISNLVNKPYDKVKSDFEKKFYSIKKGIKVFDMVKYLNGLGLKYELKFFNQNPKHFNKLEADNYSKIKGSITLIFKSGKYPVGHYLLRTKVVWIDPWFNLPNIDNMKAGVRKTLPTNAWYVIYPINNL
jgi:hypothetical protein